MRRTTHLLTFITTLSMLLFVGCISTSASGKTYVSMTPLLVIGGIIFLVSFLRK